MMPEAFYSLLTLVNISRPIWPMSTSPKCFLVAKVITTNTHEINGGQYKQICWRVGRRKQLKGEVEEANS
jgi:hypothetical protein